MAANEIIKARKQALGLTFRAIGQHVGVASSTVKKWESGDIANMRCDKVAKLAEVLEVSPGYLMGWDESDKPAS